MKRVVKNGAPGPRQSHMNTSKFDPNKYKQKQEQVPEKVMAVMTTLCCRRCCEIIQWKVDYGKYIPTEVSRKCNLCAKKNVALAYHRICRDCAVREARCAKCQKPIEDLLLSRDDDTASTASDISEAEEEAQEDKVNRFAFLENEPKHEELKRLRGLDIRALEREIDATIRQEQQEELKRLPERKRRTVLRAQEQNRDSDDDDDDELL